MMLFRRLPTCVLAGALLALALPVRAAEVDKLLPNETEVVLTLNVKQILESPLIKKHALEAIKEALKSNAEAQQVLEALGLDPLKDVASITAASPGIAENDKGLLIIHGRFSVARFQAKAEDVAQKMKGLLKVHKVDGITLYELSIPSQDKPMFVGVINESTLVASPLQEYVKEAFDKAAGKQPGMQKKDVRALIEKADANQSLWIVVAGSALAKAGATASDEKTKKNLDTIEAVVAGVTLTGGVKLQSHFQTKTPEAAKGLAAELTDGLNQAKVLIGVLANNEKKLAPAVEVLNALETTTEAGSVLIKGEVSEESFEKSLRGQ